jgi:DNA repair ATPase RecN
MDSELDKAIRKLTYTTTEQPLEKIRESLSQMSRSVDEVAKVSSIQGSTEIAKLVQLPLYFFKRTVDELMQLKSTIDYQDNQIIAMEARIKALENRK